MLLFIFCEKKRRIAKQFDTKSLQIINQRDYYQVTGSVLGSAGLFDAHFGVLCTT